VQLTGSSGSWTVVVATSAGAKTLAVVSQSTGRVTSGPFPQSQSSAAQSQLAAMLAALKVPYTAAISTASKSSPAAGAATAAVLGGTTADPRWTISFKTGSVVVDGISGAVA
jgi:hypothetical protein